MHNSTIDWQWATALDHAEPPTETPSPSSNPCWDFPWECDWTTEVVGYEEQEQTITVCQVHGREA